MTDTGKKELASISEALFLIHKNDPEYNFLIDLLNKIPENILIIDKNSTVLFVNESYLNTFQVKRERIIGRELKKFEPLARIHDVLATGQPLTGDISHVYSAQKDMYADIIPLFSDHTLVGAMALMRDVTELTHVNQELEHFQNLTKTLKTQLDSKAELPQAFHHIIGQDPNFINMLHTAARASRSNASICIIGESGTGKEVLANAIHYSSKRADGPLVKINCAAIPENLLESELFGYEAGAFTGAKTNGKPGKFELANHGTIFLDEIGELPLSMQVKLLRVLQEHKVERIGGEHSIDLDFRLITATNRNLEEMIGEGTFREDLYYRINVIGLNIPPLRERSADIEIFARMFLEELNQKYERNYSFTKQAIFAITNYSWPGNVRELKNYVERAAILSYDDVIGVEQLPEKIKSSRFTQSPHQQTFQLHELLENTEREAIINTLQLCKGNKTQAIEILGISRRCFYQKLSKYNLLLNKNEAL